MPEYAPTPKQADLIGRITKCYEGAKGHHGAFVKLYERGERAYRGVLQSSSEAAKWRHRVHPPYGFNLLETVVANTIEMGLRVTARPSPLPGASLDEALKMASQASVIEALLRSEYRKDKMDGKQRPLFLCDGICGMGVGKTYWNWTSGAVRRQGIEMTDVHDENGNAVMQVPTIKEIVTDGVLRDHSTTEVVDPRDFIIHESARSLQPFEPGGAQWVIHRCWYSMEQLKMLEASGFIKDVQYLSESRDQSSEYQDRETEVFDINRTKDLVEVWEYWCMDEGYVGRAMIGNRKVLLRDASQAGGAAGDIEKSPFWHGGYPFFTVSSQPQLFSPRGVGDIELIEQLQKILWELQNQRLDNLELVNNAIMLIRSDVDDPDAFEWYPGAYWPVDSTDQVEALQPPYQVAELSLNAENLLKGDMQNVTSATLMAGGAETGSVDQKTATGASLVMNAAQQRLTAKKFQAQLGILDEAAMRIKNCQQFISPQHLIHDVGPDGADIFHEISPLDIQGEYGFELEPMGESQMRQERRAEATQLLTALLQAAPVVAMAGSPLNMKEVLKDFFKSWGKDDAEKFLSQDPQSAMAAMAGGQSGQAGPQGPAPAAPAGPNLGITADSAVDASSPSATGGASMSPVVALQRALAMGGGANNT